MAEGGDLRGSHRSIHSPAPQKKLPPSPRPGHEPLLSSSGHSPRPGRNAEEHHSPPPQKLPPSPRPGRNADEHHSHKLPPSPRPGRNVEEHHSPPPVRLLASPRATRAVAKDEVQRAMTKDDDELHPPEQEAPKPPVDRVSHRSPPSQRKSARAPASHSSRPAGEDAEVVAQMPAQSLGRTPLGAVVASKRGLLNREHWDAFEEHSLVHDVESKSLQLYRKGGKLRLEATLATVVMVAVDPDSELVAVVTWSGGPRFKLDFPSAKETSRWVKLAARWVSYVRQVRLGVVLVAAAPSKSKEVRWAVCRRPCVWADGVSFPWPARCLGLSEGGWRMGADLSAPVPDGRRGNHSLFSLARGQTVWLYCA